ncbi:Piso0_000125 [Millerozyma farinosa CBS 7064]|uniref:Piso0_000125 protein n=1 Tax=Pichia sorbitophila (strain ATCC MYA-4447 / BCRC 22081 / CBS 7064 / NBRC 10061 / NRRL Y-12695) TaxID=559304 RepID=G8YUL0_PICSO|nr:Piso0_000125 [Millerozyma farinosa CBS 7064]
MEKENQWRDEILDKLGQRDALEKKDSEYYRAFSQLSEAFRNISTGGSDSKDLSEEILRLKQENETLRERLNKVLIGKEKSELKTRQSTSKQEQLERQSRLLLQKIEHLEMEVSEKNKTIEITNDELLTSQIHNNVLDERISRLSAENEKLVQRWIDKVKADAEKLNDANEFLQNVHSKHTKKPDIAQ